MIGVVGLGLIGGSLAKALNQNTDYLVYGCDIDNRVCKKAKLVNAIEDILTEDILKECDITIVALYPEATLKYIRENAHNFKKGSIVLDCCGTKYSICKEASIIARENGFTFMGGHPMAGLEHSGFSYAKKALFDKASMVLTPILGTKIEDVETIKNLCASIGFSNIQISTPEEHDKMIAFTSQLPHIISSAYIKSDVATNHEGFSAGSYKDLSRVSKLNEDMWAELFIDNKNFLVDEIHNLITRLEEYKVSIENQDADTLRNLLKEGRERKAQIDKEYF